jgi:hypothetical protein
VAGCGGGGGGGSQTSANPGAEVQARQQTLDTAMVQENLNGVLNLISDAFRDGDGATKTDLRAAIEAYFQDFDVLQVETLSADYLVSTDNSKVTQTIRQRITDRDRTSGAQDVYETDDVVEWVKESGVWKIVGMAGENAGIQKVIRRRR